MATKTVLRSPSARSSGQCPKCGSDQLADADGVPVCTSCPLPFAAELADQAVQTDRKALYRLVANSRELKLLKRAGSALERLQELVQEFDTAVIRAGSSVVAWLGDTEDTACIANDLLAGINGLELQFEVIRSALPASR